MNMHPAAKAPLSAADNKSFQPEKKAMTMQSLSTTTTELKPVELQSYLDEGWRIFVDTCSFISSGCEPFFTRSAAAFRDAGVSIHCPKEVRRELEKNLSSPKEQTRQLAMRGLAAYDALDKLDLLHEIDCPGSQALPHFPLRRQSRRRPGPRPQQAERSLPTPRTSARALTAGHSFALRRVRPSICETSATGCPRAARHAAPSAAPRKRRSNAGPTRTAPSSTKSSTGFAISSSRSPERGRSSCRKYAGALYGTLSRMAEMPLSEIDSVHEFEQIAEGLRQLDAFSQLNKTGNHMYSSALKWYARYLEAVEGRVLPEADDIE